MSNMGDHELTFSNYLNIYLSLLLDICHIRIRIIHIFVFFQCEPYSIHSPTHTSIITHEYINKTYSQT
jgi:hypothetical protein